MYCGPDWMSSIKNTCVIFLVPCVVLYHYLHQIHIFTLTLCATHTPLICHSRHACTQRHRHFLPCRSPQRLYAFHALHNSSIVGWFVQSNKGIVSGQGDIQCSLQAACVSGRALPPGLPCRRNARQRRDARD